MDGSGQHVKTKSSIKLKTLNARSSHQLLPEAEDNLCLRILFNLFLYQYLSSSTVFECLVFFEIVK